MLLHNGAFVFSLKGGRARGALIGLLSAVVLGLLVYKGSLYLKLGTQANNVRSTSDVLGASAGRGPL